MAEQHFRVRAYKRVTKTTPRPDAEAGPYSEPAAAADWAEMWLTGNGTPDESFVDLYFNGEPNIHTSIYLMSDPEDAGNTFGILNSTHAKWPMHYMEGDGMELAAGEEPFGRDTDEWLPGDSDEDETDEDADVLDLGNDGGDDDDEDEGGDEEEDGSDEDGEDDFTDEPEDEDEDDSDSDGEDSDKGDSDNDAKREVPRMTIFGKFKGPKGWRKRAETDPERDMNSFAIKFGVLDPDRRTSAQQERNSRVEIRFIERDSRRDAGELRIRIPDGVTMRDDGKWLVAEIPYTDNEEED